MLSDMFTFDRGPAQLAACPEESEIASHTIKQRVCNKNLSLI